MDIRLHQVRYRLIDELMTAQRRQSDKLRAADRDMEMTARTRAGMACVQGAVVADFQQFRLQGCLQACS